MSTAATGLKAAIRAPASLFALVALITATTHQGMDVEGKFTGDVINRKAQCPGWLENVLTPRDLNPPVFRVNGASTAV